MNDNHRKTTPSRIAICLRLTAREVCGGNGGKPKVTADAAHCAATVFTGIMISFIHSESLSYALSFSSSRVRGLGGASRGAQPLFIAVGLSKASVILACSTVDKQNWLLFGLL
jgi:hypothetical protein